MRKVLNNSLCSNIDYSSSETFKDFEPDLLGIRHHSLRPLNEEDFIDKPIGLKIIEHLLAINFVPSLPNIKKQTRGIPL
jgi:hypothetical protein